MTMENPPFTHGVEKIAGVELDTHIDVEKEFSESHVEADNESGMMIGTFRTSARGFDVQNPVAGIQEVSVDDDYPKSYLDGMVYLVVSAAIGNSDTNEFHEFGSGIYLTKEHAKDLRDKLDEILDEEELTSAE